MKCVFRIGAIGFALLATTFAAAQTGPAYRVKDEVVVKGKVASVKTISDWMGRDGVNLSLEGNDVSLPHVDVATADFLHMLDFPISAGDDLTLRGCWSKSAEGEPVFLVREVTKERVLINVRDARGVPVW